LECCCRKLKKNPQNTNGRLAIPAPAGLLVSLIIIIIIIIITIKQQQNTS